MEKDGWEYTEESKDVVGFQRQSPTLLRAFVQVVLQAIEALFSMPSMLQNGL